MFKSHQPTSSRELIRVLVADGTPLTGRLIADSLRRDRGLDVVDASGGSVLMEATSLAPHVIILSAQLDGKSDKGFEILKQLRVLVPPSKVIMLLDYDEAASLGVYFAATILSRCSVAACIKCMKASFG
jgi:DNA-binding NarL/FixJ family response regulator